MEFKNIAAELGITAYPPELDKEYSELSGDVDISSIEFLEELEKNYSALREHYDIVKRGAEELKNDHNRRIYGNVVVSYIRKKTTSVRDAIKVPMPASDATLAGDMLPLLILLQLVPASADSYKERGFTDAEVERFVACYRNCMNAVKVRVGRLGINQMYYNWCCLYAKCTIFNYGIFNVEIKQLPNLAIILKNRNSGEYAAVLTSGRFHRSGHTLGSAGAEDEEGAFDAEYSETDDAYIGKLSVNGFAVNEIHTFKKSEWECFVAPGDDIISVHIPKGADFSPEKIEEGFKNGLAMAKERFTEFKPKCVYCSSWLLDPTLEEIIGGPSKITAFGNRFLRFPHKSAGLEVFSFVFPGKSPKELEELPENTRLERGLKKLYLDGGFAHGFGGVVVY